MTYEIDSFSTTAPLPLSLVFADYFLVNTSKYIHIFLRDRLTKIGLYEEKQSGLISGPK